MYECSIWLSSVVYYYSTISLYVQLYVVGGCKRMYECIIWLSSGVYYY